MSQSDVSDPHVTVPLCSGCGGYEDACHCDNPGYPPPGWQPQTDPIIYNFVSPLPGGPVLSLRERLGLPRLPTLAERLADSIRDDRAA